MTARKRQRKDGPRVGLIPGLVLHGVAEAFRVGPLLEDSVSRQLREWRDGVPKDLPTQRKLIHALVDAIMGGLGPVHVVEAAVLRWSRWVTEEVMPAAPSNPELAAHWVVEHTLMLAGLLLGVCRHALGVALPERVTIPEWLPTSLDRQRRSPTGELLAESFQRIEVREGRQFSLRQEIENARRNNIGRQVKPATIKAWRTGRTVPNGQRVAELAAAVGDPMLPIKLGIRNVVERLALKSGGERDANTTLVWMSLVEWRAVEVHRELCKAGDLASAVTEVLAGRQSLELALPAFTKEATAEDLPANLAGRPYLLLEWAEANERVGLMLVRTPEEGQRLAFSVGRAPKR
jgi:hypothetical protein